MNRYIVKTNEQTIDIPYDPYYLIVGHTYEIMDIEEFKSILETENLDYANYVCDYWNKYKGGDNVKK